MVYNEENSIVWSESKSQRSVFNNKVGVCVCILFLQKLVLHTVKHTGKHGCGEALLMSEVRGEWPDVIR